VTKAEPKPATAAATATMAARVIEERMLERYAFMMAFRGMENDEK
jgi:hypothetical protein